MYIKTSTYRRKKFKELIEYIAHDKGRIDPENTFTICHNLRSTEIQDIIREFEENDQYRKQRTRGVVLYHEILSYSPEDKEYISLELLEETAHKFIDLRGANSLCFAMPHIENDNIHIHFCFSGTEFRSSKTLRLDKKRFREIRLEMEEHQLQYPELSNSLAYLNAWQKEKMLSQEKESQNEFQMKQRTQKKSKKEVLTDLLQSCYQQSTSKDDFFTRLVGKGLRLYKYRNKINGIVFEGKKFRFRTLKLPEQQLTLLEKNYDRMASLQKLWEQKGKDTSLERER